MFNNSTKINKTNNHLASELSEKKPWHVTLEIQILASVRHKNVVWFNWLMGSQPSILDNWISNGNTYINKPAQIRFHPKRTYTITQTNDNINMDSTIAEWLNARR